MGSPCSRRMDDTWPSRRTAPPRPGRTTPTSSWPPGRRRWCIASPRPPPTASSPTCGGWPPPSEGGAASGRPAWEGGSFRQVFQVPTDVKVGEDSSLAVGGVTLARDDFTIAAYSGAGHARGDLLLAGYGIVEPRLGVDDYRGLDARNKIVVVRRFAPEGAPFTD